METLARGPIEHTGFRTSQDCACVYILEYRHTYIWSDRGDEGREEDADSEMPGTA